MSTFYNSYEFIILIIKQEIPYVPIIMVFNIPPLNYDLIFTLSLFICSQWTAITVHSPS